MGKRQNERQHETARERAKKTENNDIEDETGRERKPTTHISYRVIRRNACAAKKNIDHK